MGNLATDAIRSIMSRIAARYLGKGLEKDALREVSSVTKRKLVNAGKELSGPAMKKATVRAVRIKSAKNAVGDASDAALLGGSLWEGQKLDSLHKQKVLENKVKQQYPKLYQQYAASKYTDMGEFLKSKGVTVS